MATEATTDQTIADMFPGGHLILSLPAAYTMLHYTQAMSSIALPASIPPLDIMPTVTIQQLYANVAAHVKSWTAVSSEIQNHAEKLIDFAEVSIAYVNQMVTESNDKLNSTAYNNLTADQRTALKNEFQGMTARLKQSALSYAQHAAKVSSDIAAFSNAIKQDGAAAQTVYGDYESWINNEDVTIAAWERENNQPDSDALLQELAREVATLQSQVKDEEWVVGAAAAGTGLGLLLFFIFPPLLIGGAVTTGVEAEKLLKDKAAMRALEARFAEVQRYNNMKVFFSAVKEGLTLVATEADNATQMLDALSGNWNLMAHNLDIIATGFSGIEALEPFNPGDWSTPIQQFQANLPIQTYQNVMADAQVYISRSGAIEVGDLND